MPKERWNVLILDTLLAIVGFVRFVNDTGNYLTIKRKVLVSLTSSLESLIIYQAGRFTRVYNRGIVSTLGVDISLKYYIYISGNAADSPRKIHCSFRHNSGISKPIKLRLWKTISTFAFPHRPANRLIH